MEKDKLRKADIFSGVIFILFGFWIISQALKMPMKDSWGGVQNVWFVSPALFPLLVGAVISTLGILLAGMAVISVGGQEFGRLLRWLASSQLIVFLQTNGVIRFYAMSVLFFGFVYLNLPRIDFFLCSILFLAVFISMFYFDDDRLLKKLFAFYLAGSIVCLGYFALGLSETLEATLPYPNDWLAVVFIVSYLAYAWILIRQVPALRKKYRTSLVLAVVPPFLICPVFKYFLLVPMPTEGLVVAMLDAIWYWDF
ncbi:MAG: hypothetical protein AMJ54_03725 [Deltaproteobacteria bacterium SG8_13]|nr:MAG: hypothetical protein AMJ54_03725 [Deltaproteobacteria bacterium SG8_13]